MVYLIQVVNYNILIFAKLFYPNVDLFCLDPLLQQLFTRTRVCCIYMTVLMINVYLFFYIYNINIISISYNHIIHIYDLHPLINCL
jgi:hypothetical protein